MPVLEQPLFDVQFNLLLYVQSDKDLCQSYRAETWRSVLLNPPGNASSEVSSRLLTMATLLKHTMWVGCDIRMDTPQRSFRLFLNPH